MISTLPVEELARATSSAEITEKNVEGSSSPGREPRGRSNLKGYDRQAERAFKLDTLGFRRALGVKASRIAERGEPLETVIDVEVEKKTCFRLVG